MLRLHREEGLSFEEIRDQTGACDGCTSCEPYVRLTLSTGVTNHPVLEPREVERILRGV
jgi:NAD(P)H-nitrite reductase large subunit